MRFPVTGAESDKSSILLLRLQKEDGGFIWTHSVLQVILHHENPYYSIRWWLVYILIVIKKKLIVIIGDVSVCNDVFPATRRRGGVRHPRDHFDKPDSQQRGGGGMIVVNNITTIMVNP